MNEWWLGLVMLAIPAGGALVANRLARKKNRPVRGWTIAGLLFPFSVVVMLFLPSREPATQADREREARLKADWRGHLRQIYANQRSMAHFMATAATVVLAVVLVVVTYPSVDYTDPDEIAPGIPLLAAMYLMVWLLGSLISVIGRGITRVMVLRTDGTPRAMYRSEEDSAPSDRRTQQRLGTAFLAGLTLLFVGAIVYSVAYRLSGEEITVKVLSRHEEQHISGYRIPGFITSLWVSTDRGDFQIESAWTFSCSIAGGCSMTSRRARRTRSFAQDGTSVSLGRPTSSRSSKKSPHPRSPSFPRIHPKSTPNFSWSPTGASPKRSIASGCVCRRAIRALQPCGLKSPPSKATAVHSSD